MKNNLVTNTHKTNQTSLPLKINPIKNRLNSKKITALKCKSWFLCRKNSLKQQFLYNKYESITNNIRQYFDFSSFINKMQQIDKILLLLLGENNTEFFKMTFDIRQTADIGKIERFIKSEQTDVVNKRLQNIVNKAFKYII